jgi:hypothetical protein
MLASLPNPLPRRVSCTPAPRDTHAPLARQEDDRRGVIERAREGGEGGKGEKETRKRLVAEDRCAAAAARAFHRLIKSRHCPVVNTAAIARRSRVARLSRGRNLTRANRRVTQRARATARASPALVTRNAVSVVGG